MEKAFSCGKTGKWPEKRRTGKRANEIECPEKGKGKAPDLKSSRPASAQVADGVVYSATPGGFITALTADEGQVLADDRSG